MGQDTLTGGSGADTFVLNTTAETGTNLTDVILDFNRAAGDRIDVSGVDAIETLAGNQAFTFVGVVDFSGSQFTGAGQIGRASCRERV